MRKLRKFFPNSNRIERAIIRFTSLWIMASHHVKILNRSAALYRHLIRQCHRRRIRQTIDQSRDKRKIAIGMERVQFYLTSSTLFFFCFCCYQSKGIRFFFRLIISSYRVYVSSFFPLLLDFLISFEFLLQWNMSKNIFMGVTKSFGKHSNFGGNVAFHGILSNFFAT